MAREGHGRAMRASDEERPVPVITPRLAEMTDGGEVDAGLAASLRGLGHDGRTLFALRTLRMFGYGFLAVILVLYLAASGLDRKSVV